MQIEDLKPGLRSGNIIWRLYLLRAADDDSFAWIGQWRIHDGYDAVPNYSVSAGTARAGDGLLALLPPQESL